MEAEYLVIKEGMSYKEDNIFIASYLLLTLDKNDYFLPLSCRHTSKHLRSHLSHTHGTVSQDVEVSLLYANQEEDDILVGDELTESIVSSPRSLGWGCARLERWSRRRNKVSGGRWFSGYGFLSFIALEWDGMQRYLVRLGREHWVLEIVLSSQLSKSLIQDVSLNNQTFGPSYQL